MEGESMPKLRFTKTAIDRLPTPEKGQVDYFDEATGLGLRVGKRSKTFFAKTDVKDPNTKTGYRTVKKTLGRYGDLTLEQAKKMLQGHDDPDQGFVPGARLKLKRKPTEAKGAETTLCEMLEQFLCETRARNGHVRKKSTADDYRARISQHFDNWLDVTLPEIGKLLTPDLLIDTHRQITENNGPYAARNAFVVLSAVLNYAVVKYPGVMPKNPVSFLTRKDAGILAPIKAREDCVKGQEFRDFHEGIKGFNGATQDCYLLALYQGMRSNEAAALRWEYLDLEKEELKVPDTKNRHVLHVPLCRQSLKILRRRQVQAIDGSPWVFASNFRLNKTGHVRLTAAGLRLKTGLELTVHGLRRSFITEGRRLKLKEDADRLTNHFDGSVSGRFYDQTEIEDMRQSLQTIADSIERQLTGESAKVVELLPRQYA